MHIYVRHKSERLDFVIHFLNKHFLLDEAIVTDKMSLFDRSSEFKINYSNENLNAQVQLKPEGLLFENHIRAYSDPFSYDLSKRKECDIFSRIFYSLSRYEEHQIKERDEHNRFSISFLPEEQRNQKKTPYIDQGILDFFEKLERQSGVRLLKKRKFELLCTFDIDVAYAYKGRSSLRSFDAGIRNSLKARSSLNRERKRVLSGSQKDPFDNYDYLKKWQIKSGLDFRYFFLLSKKGKFDHGLDPKASELKLLIQKVAEYAKVGLHPSYRSHSSLDVLEKERNTLEEITGEHCVRSRQHYLKFDVPRTFRNLLNIGIKEDYSMGFAHAVSCRAGTAFPFPWFDLEQNNRTELLLFPLHFMDSTFIYNPSRSVLEAENELLFLFNIIRNQGGYFVMNWHNNHLCEGDEFKPWRQLFEKIIESVSIS